MNIVKWNYWVDLALAVLFLICAFTGIVLIPELGLFRFFNLLILIKFHTISGIALVALVGVHLALHWKWIVVMTKKNFSRSKK